VTVSLDALDDAVFRRMNDVDFPVADVLARHRRRARLRAWARSRSTWWSSAAPTTTRSCPWRATSRARGMVLRFIEYMDVGATNGWRMDEVLPSAEVVQRIHAELAAGAAGPSAPGETAERWGYADDGQHVLGEIGVISSVTQAFCGDCNRARLSTEGKLYLCLFASQGHDLRARVEMSYIVTVPV
jgi:cyclic pyranopterin phosphate synthase